jgi:hypothetical protein
MLNMADVERRAKPFVANPAECLSPQDLLALGATWKEVLAAFEDAARDGLQCRSCGFRPTRDDGYGGPGYAWPKGWQLCLDTRVEQSDAILSGRPSKNQREPTCPTCLEVRESEAILQRGDNDTWSSRVPQLRDWLSSW